MSGDPNFQILTWEHLFSRKPQRSCIRRLLSILFRGCSEFCILPAMVQPNLQTKYWIFRKRAVILPCFCYHSSSTIVKLSCNWNLTNFWSIHIIRSNYYIYPPFFHSQNNYIGVAEAGVWMNKMHILLPYVLRHCLEIILMWACILFHLKQNKP